ncbi:MAG: type II secretion system protein GspG [Cystobacter sp.]
MKTEKTTARRGPRGMTLIEIMVVITILGLIMAAVGISVIPRLNESKRERARMDFHALKGALTLYYAKQGRFPDTATGLRALVEGHVLESVPVDPWGNPYVYLNEKGTPRITTYGDDGVSGGEGEGVDMCSCDAVPSPKGS